jgi:hypothetical protein
MPYLKKIDIIYRLWLPFRDKLVNHLYVPMNELQLTLHELIYLCGQILWSTQGIGKRLGSGSGS